MRRHLPVGKLPLGLLKSLLDKIELSDSRVRIGARIGEDAAVIDMADKYLVAKTDPITFTAEKIGRYAVNINANDIATMGAEPKWFMATLLLPENATTKKVVRRIFDDILQACAELGITLCGGHTEITHGLDRPILVGQMLGEVSRRKLVDSRRAIPGDDVLLAGVVAIEGTSIIARERGTELEKAFGPQLVRRAKRFITRPGISVVKAALSANRCAPIHAMHDPTEGGLAMGLIELAHSADTGIEIWRKAIPVAPECEKICRHFGLDPLGLLASGALLIALRPRYRKKVIDALEQKGLTCCHIGKLTEAATGCKIRLENGSCKTIPEYSSDELTRIL